MFNFFTIGEVSRLLNISTKALRNYDHIDLVKPAYVDENTSYRYYSYDQLFTIGTIKYLNKVLFIPLSDIKNILLNTENTEDTISILDNHMQYLDNKIAEYNYSKRVIDTLKYNLNNKKKHLLKNDIFEIYFMSRTLYYIDLNVPLSEIDKYINRDLLNFNNLDNTEINDMCLICSLSEYRKNKSINVIGFGIISNKPLTNLKSLTLNEGRYISYRFPYSEERCEHVISSFDDYLDSNEISTSDYIILHSNIVDLSAANKYEYNMEFQVLRHL